MSHSRTTSTGSNKDDNSNSLSDSTYELVSNPGLLTPDEDSHDEEAESLVSFDLSSAADTASLADTEESGEPESPAPRIESPLGGYVNTPTSIATPEDSSMTARGPSHSHSSSIEFQEPDSVVNGNYIDVIHTIGSVSSGPKGWNGLSSPQRILTIRQSMVSHDLNVFDRPFRILYLGHSWPKERIVEKIAQALASSIETRSRTSSANFSIIPVSAFGEHDSAPQVALIPSTGLELMVEDCTEVDKLYFTHESALSSPIFQWPDLVVCFHSLNDTVQRQRNWQRHMATLKHKEIPMLEVSDDDEADLAQDFHPYQDQAIHMCLEIRGVNLTKNRILRKMPIELSTFLSVDAGQMNRNIACITGLYGNGTYARNRDYPTWGFGKRISEETWDHLRGKANDAKDFITSITLQDVKEEISYLVENHPLQVLRNNFNNRIVDKNAVLFGLGLIMCLLAVLATHFSTAYSSGHFDEAGQVSRSESVDVLVTIPTTIPSTSEAPIRLVPGLSAYTTSPIPPADLNLGKHISVMTSETSIGIFTPVSEALHQNPANVKPRLPDGFRLLHSDDGQIYLQAPERLISSRWWDMRHPPEVFIKVLKGSQSIAASIVKIQNGFYAINLDSPSKSGQVIIRVWTETDPAIEQLFELGSTEPWLTQDAFKQVAVRLSEEGMKLSTVAIKALAESSIALQELLDQTADWRQKYLDRLWLSKQQMADMTTAIGEHLATQRVWLTKSFHKQREQFTKHFSEIQNKVSKDLSLRYDEAGLVLNRKMDDARTVLHQCVHESRHLAMKKRGMELWESLPKSIKGNPFKTARKRLTVLEKKIEKKIEKKLQRQERRYWRKCGKKHR